MKPAWDQLMEEFKDSATALVADVDCTTDGGKPLCEEVGVTGFPTIKYGSPSDMQDYNGGRDYDALSEFAKENLGPSCGPARLDLCDSEKKAAIEKLLDIPTEELEASIKEKTDALEKIETEFKSFVDGLQKQYSDAQEKKGEDEEAIKNSGLSLMKSVAASRGLVIKKPWKFPSWAQLKRMLPTQEDGLAFWAMIGVGFTLVVAIGGLAGYMFGSSRAAPAPAKPPSSQTEEEKKND